MIRLFIFCLLFSIGYVPNVSAYGAISTAPPVEKKIKNKAKKKRKVRRKKLKGIKKEKGIKVSTGLLIVAMVFAIPGMIISALASSLPLTILILGLVLLLIALGFAIAALIVGVKEKENQNSLGGENKKRDGNSLN